MSEREPFTCAMPSSLAELGQQRRSAVLAPCNMRPPHAGAPRRCHRHSSTSGGGESARSAKSGDLCCLSGGRFLARSGRRSSRPLRPPPAPHSAARSVRRSGGDRPRFAATLHRVLGSRGEEEKEDREEI